MKRNSLGYSKIINWKNCFICQQKHVTDLESSGTPSKNLASKL